MYELKLSLHGYTQNTQIITAKQLNGLLKHVVVTYMIYQKITSYYIVLTNIYKECSANTYQLITKLYFISLYDLQEQSSVHLPWSQVF